MDEKNWEKIFALVQKMEGNGFIQFLLYAGLNINALNKDGKTMLSYAEECSNFEKIMDEKHWKNMFGSIWKTEGNTFIQFLLDAGLDVNTLNKYGTTMLSYAAECGNLEIIEFLVQKGADGNVTNSEGSKPLHIAAKYGHKDIVKFFLDKGIFVDSRDNHKNTPLHYTVVAGESNQELVHFLVDSNADLNAVNRYGSTPLLYAAFNSLQDLAKLFIKLGANIQCCDGKGWTVLHHSCQRGLSEIVQSLVEERFDIDLNARTSEGYTPLLIASGYSCKDIVELLLKLGANVEGYSNSLGWTVLHGACQDGWLDVVKSLVNKGCDLDAKSLSGHIPLLLAAVCEHFDVVKYLVESGADVNCCTEYGWTALHFACQRGRLDVVRSLVVKGCDLNAKAFEGKRMTPLLIAARYLNSSVVEYLIKSGADVKGCDKDGHTVLYYACNMGLLNVVKCLINKGCDPNAKDSAGESPFLSAADSSHFSVVEYLIESGADVTCCNDFGWTVLHCACKNEWLDVVKSLIKKGSDPNARDEDRDTPLHVAVRAGNLQIIKHLLKAGADCNVEDVTGKTEFNDFMQSPFCIEGIVMFLENGAYFQADDYVANRENPLFKEGVLQDVKLCIQAVVNKFNNGDLPKIYEIPVVAESLPRIEKLKVASHSNVAQNIADSVKYEIQTKGYCNVLNVRPIALNSLCIECLVKHYDSLALLK